MKKIFIIITILHSLFANEFNEGPYGSGYFDIAGPFSVPDLNITIQGDPNFDETVNIHGEESAFSLSILLTFLSSIFSASRRVET